MKPIAFIPCLPPGLHAGMDAVAHGLAAALRDHGRDLRLFPADLRGARGTISARQEAAVAAAVAAGADALVLFVLDVNAPAPAIVKARAAGVAVVAIHKPCYPVNATLVVPNYHHGVVLAQALARALPRGARAAILGGPDILDDIEMVRGAVAGARDCGLQVINDPFLPRYRNLDDVRGGGRDAAEHLLDDFYPFDGLLVFNDETVLDAVEVLERRGLGGQLPTVSRNGSPEATALVACGHTLATFDYHLPEIGDRGRSPGTALSGRRPAARRRRRRRPGGRPLHARQRSPLRSVGRTRPPSRAGDRVTLDELVTLAHETMTRRRPATAAPDWALGCFRRRSITFFNGSTDSSTQVLWLQTHGLTADLRLPAARPTASEVGDPGDGPFEAWLALAAAFEGGLARSSWDGERMMWSDWTALQLHDKWPEPGILRRVGDCLIEYAPSGAYVEDWRLQPSPAGPLLGLTLLEERDLGRGEVVHRGGGLVVCGRHAAFVRGRPRPLPLPAPSGGARLVDVVRTAVDNRELLRAAFAFDASYGVQAGDGADYVVVASTDPRREHEPLLTLDGFSFDGHQGQVVQRAKERGRSAGAGVRARNSRAQFPVFRRHPRGPRCPRLAGAGHVIPR